MCGGTKLDGDCASGASSSGLQFPFQRLVLFHLTLFVCAGLAFGATDSAAQKAQEHAERGLDLAQSGDLNRAEAELRRAVSLSPDNPNYLAALGGILGTQQKLEEASVYFEKALKIEPGNLAVRRNLATGQWQLGHLRDAEINLQRILKAQPGDPPTLLLLGMVSENLKGYAKAARLLESVNDLVKQHPEAIAALARSYYETAQNHKAEETLEALLSHTGEPQGVFVGGEIASQAGDEETALKLFEAIRSTYPDRALLSYNVALARYRGGHFPEAEKILLDLISGAQPTSSEYNLLAWCYYKQDKFQETVRAMDQAIDLDRGKESNYLDLCEMLMDRKLLPMARTVATTAVERIPGCFHCYMMKGLIEAKQGAYTDAVSTYRSASALNRDSSAAHSNLAKMQWQAGLTDEAQATFQRGIERFPNDALTYQEFALMLLKLSESGNTSLEAYAVSLLRQASALDKSLAEPHYQLGSLWLKRGKPTEALHELQTAAKLDPNEAKTHFALSRVYRRLGQTEQEAAELAAYDTLKETKPN